MGVGMKPHHVTHILHIHSALQQCTGNFNAVGNHIVAHREACGLLKHFTKPGLAYKELLGQLFQRDVLIVVGVDIPQNLPRPAFHFDGWTVDERGGIGDPCDHQQKVQEFQFFLTVAAKPCFDGFIQSS